MHLPEAFTPDSMPEYSSEGAGNFLFLLEKWVAQMIAHHPEKLRRILYRLDVHESDAGLAALGENPARQLAWLIWQREQEKAVSRRRHSGPPPPPDPELDW